MVQTLPNTLRIVHLTVPMPITAVEAESPCKSFMSAIQMLLIKSFLSGVTDLEPPVSITIGRSSLLEKYTKHRQVNSLNVFDDSFIGPVSFKMVSCWS